jgi:pimeloyl-ACP methyl ester carboxylesterase
MISEGPDVERVQEVDNQRRPILGRTYGQHWCTLTLVSPTRMKIEHFRPRVPDVVLNDLASRLDATRLPHDLGNGSWSHGTSVGHMRDLLAYWRDGFDWRAQEAWISRWPHYIADFDGQLIHFARVALGRGQRPLVLTHGWPSTFYEPLHLLDALERRSDSAGFDVVIPSLPGYGFSSPPSRPWTLPRTHEIWHELMHGVLGFDRYGAHGTDLGAGVTARLGMFHPEHVTGIHVTGVYAPGAESASNLTAGERDFIAMESRWDVEEGGYAHIQATRPLTLAYGLTDSPVGLAAWIVEKFRAWSDCGGDVSLAFTHDQLLTTVMLYWASGTIGSSFLPYYEARHNPAPIAWKRITVPCAVALFPADLSWPPREWAERYYRIERWTEMPAGGHFPAMEEPELLAADIVGFFQGLEW